MTRGETHLRQEVNFGSPTESRLNLGAFDWTIEFWFRPMVDTGQEGVVLELGTGPRESNEQVTRLLFNADRKGFTLQNGTAGNELEYSYRWHCPGAASDGLASFGFRI